MVSIFIICLLVFSLFWNILSLYFAFHLLLYGFCLFMFRTASLFQYCINFSLNFLVVLLWRRVILLFMGNVIWIVCNFHKNINFHKKENTLLLFFSPTIQRRKQQSYLTGYTWSSEVCSVVWSPLGMPGRAVSAASRQLRDHEGKPRCSDHRSRPRQTCCFPLSVQHPVNSTRCSTLIIE